MVSLMKLGEYCSELQERPPTRWAHVFRAYKRTALGAKFCDVLSSRVGYAYRDHTYSCCEFISNCDAQSHFKLRSRFVSDFHANEGLDVLI